jgi:hypothetical protein
MERRQTFLVASLVWTVNKAIALARETVAEWSGRVRVTEIRYQSDIARLLNEANHG